MCNCPALTLHLPHWHLSSSRPVQPRDQPGRSGDLWLHETTVSWIRERLKRSLPKDPWNETEESFTKRMKKAVEHVNDEHDVAGLCREMPSRMHDLVHATRGDRLRK